MNMCDLIIVRGLPGSGKSTLAKQLAAGHYGPCHFEADMYFHINPEGTYKFNPALLSKAHEWCKDQVKNSLKVNGFAVVSNTFTTKKELRPYFELAKEMNANVQVITCQGNFQNVHNVPADKLDAMRKRFEYDISDLF